MNMIDVVGLVAIAGPLLLVVFLGGYTLFGRPISESSTARAVSSITLTGLFATLIVLGYMLTTGTRHVVVGYGEWVHLQAEPGHSAYHFAIKFVFDRLSIPFVILTYLLLGTVGAFSNRYMHREPGYNRFFILYAMFFAGMVLAALAGTIETLFLGWELVGLSSALLVGFFQERSAPSRNALRVWVVYRISDAALLLAAVLLHHTSGQGDFDQLTGYRVSAGQEVASWPEGICQLTTIEILAVGGLLVLAATGKSALVPFSGWLPRAMEGPTPSSALFYGALSVHLGAYLLLRMDPILKASPSLSYAVLLLGLTTAAVATVMTRVQTDIKSSLAFASLTQVGLIVAEIGLGWRYIPLAHLIGHACLRTLQFIRAPSIIRDIHFIDNAVGDRAPLGQVGWLGALGQYLYRFGLERAYLDTMLDRFLVVPLVRLFQWFDSLEVMAIKVLNRSPE